MSHGRIGILVLDQNAVLYIEMLGQIIFSALFADSVGEVGLQIKQIVFRVGGGRIWRGIILLFTAVRAEDAAFGDGLAAEFTVHGDGSFQ